VSQRTTCALIALVFGWAIAALWSWPDSVVIRIVVTVLLLGMLGGAVWIYLADRIHEGWR